LVEFEPEQICDVANCGRKVFFMTQFERLCIYHYKERDGVGTDLSETDELPTIDAIQLLGQESISEEHQRQQPISGQTCSTRETVLASSRSR